MVKNQCGTHTVKYYSAIKRNEIMPFAPTWMDLETGILNEVKSEVDVGPQDFGLVSVYSFT